MTLNDELPRLKIPGAFDENATNDKKLETDKKLNELLAEISSNEVQLTSIIRSSIENLLHIRFMVGLKSIISDSNKSLRNHCNKNYYTLVGAINELLKLKDDFHDLKNETSSICSGIQESTSFMQAKIEDQMSKYESKKNIKLTLSLLEQCLPVFDTFIELNANLEHNELQMALANYKKLTKQLLPPLKDFRFIDAIIETMPSYKNKILENTKKNLVNFLESARIKSQDIGRKVIECAKNYFGLAENNKTEIPEIFDGLLQLVDFSPIHIFSMIIKDIGVKGKDEFYYKFERSSQAKILYEWIKSPSDNTIVAFQKYLNNIVGFFVIELYVSNMVDLTFNKSQLSEMFENCMTRLLNQFELINNLTDLNEVYNLKTNLNHFNIVITNMGFSTSVILECQGILNDIYKNINANNAVQKLDNISLNMKLENLHLTDSKHRDNVMGNLPLPVSIDNNNYPKVLPFSAYVPHIYREIINYINESRQFSLEGKQDISDSEHSLRVSAKFFLNQVIYKHILLRIDQVKSISEISQLYTDVRFIDNYLPYLDLYVRNLANSQKNVSTKRNMISIKDETIFKTSLLDIEHKIIENISMNMDATISDILGSELENYKYTSSSFNFESSKNLVQSLNRSFVHLSSLPNAALKHIFIQIIKRIGVYSMDMLCTMNSIPFTAEKTLQVLLKEIVSLEEYFKTIKEDILDNETKNILLMELRQSLELLINEDFSYYFDNYGQLYGKYTCVHPKKIYLIYKRLKEQNIDKKQGTKFKSVFSNILKNTKMNQSSKSGETNYLDILNALKNLN